MIDTEYPRPIRSFVRREGRMTAAQRQALERLLPRLGLEAQGPELDLDAVFGRQAPRVLEIGFGDGNALLELARSHPEVDYIGAEVHRPGVGRLLLRAEREDITNLRVICADATTFLDARLPKDCLDIVNLFFPDPWPKKRHHKRRLVQPDFVTRVRRRLNRGGTFHLATDWEDYAMHMLAVMEAAPGFENAVGPGRFADRGERPVTKYERRGTGLGHRVWDLRYIRTNDRAD